MSGGGFEQSYNAQAGVDIDTMLVITAHVTQACNDKREVVPTLKQIAALPEALGEVHTLVADNGFYSQANVVACAQTGVEPLLARKRESHHEPLMERFASDPDAPQATDPLTNMVHRPSTQGGKALYKLCKQTVEPVLGIIKQVTGWHQMNMRGLHKVEGARRVEPRHHGLEHQAHARLASGVRVKVRADHAETAPPGGPMHPQSASSTIESTRSARDRPKTRVAPIIRIRSGSSPTSS